MKFAIETAGFGILVPACLSIAVAWAIRRFFPRDAGRLISGAIGCAAGFFAGFAALETGNLRPTTYWHWLPWVGVVASIAGPIGLLPRVPTAGRWGLWLTAAIGCGWLLVPNWADLNPPRIAYVSIFAAVVFLLTSLLEILARRNPSSSLSMSLCISAWCGAVLLSAFVSLRFGLLTVAAAAALSGCCVVSTRDSARELVRGVILFYSVVVGGLMLVGELAAVLPRVCFLLILAASLMLWLCEFLPAATASNKRAFVIRLVAVASPLAAAFLVAL